MIDVSRKEVERYLGYGGVSAVDEDIKKIIDECIVEMEKSVTPRYTYRFFPIEWKSEGLSFAGIDVKEGNLTRNLTGCSEIAMLAITLGPAPDMLVRRAELKETLRAMVFQATGAAMAEAWCDEINERIRSEAAEKELYLRPRFSPGYGDFPLEVQRDFERILEMPKSIGVSLSESLLMTPTKSITAVIGLSKENKNCHITGCEACNMSGSCDYAR